MRWFFFGFLLLSSSWLSAASFEEGKAAFAHQDWPNAVRLLAQFVQDRPDDPQAPSAALLQGVALYQEQKYLESLDVFQKMERAWPLSSLRKRLPYWQGAAALAAGQWDLAERTSAEQAHYPHQEPFTTRAVLNLALARQKLNRLDGAVEALQEFTKKSQEAELLAQAWFTWGQIDAAQNRVTAALEHWNSCSQAEPNGIWDLPARTLALDLVLDRQKWSLAASLLEKARKAFPQKENLWDSRTVVVARATGDVGTQEKALERLWKLSTDGKRKQEWASDRARVAEDQGKAEPQWWLRASQGPDLTLGAAALLRYAYWIEKSEKYAQAATALDAWIKSSPSASGESRQSVLDRSALDWMAANDGPAAARHWTTLITSFPQSKKTSVWLLARGRWDLSQSDTTGALEDFSRILHDFPQSAEVDEAKYQTGLVYLARQEPIRAEAWFYGLVQSLKPSDLYERALLARGVSFVNAGKTELARGSLQRLIREAPQSPWRGDAWAALGRNALSARLFPEAIDALSKAETLHHDPLEKAADLWLKAQADADNQQPELASSDFHRYRIDYPQAVHTLDALYRQGQVFLTANLPQRALEAWGTDWGPRGSAVRASIRTGRALAYLRLNQPEKGWADLEALEKEDPHPEAWYQWGEAATLAGSREWAQKAFETLLKLHPDSSVAEAALPRAAGALLESGNPDEALERYANYFKKFGGQTSAAPVARAAAAAALPYPQTLEALVTQARTWKLCPEVATEFSLAWAQSRLDAEPEAARKELMQLGQTAPWSTQRSEALLLLGRWDLGKSDLSNATTELEAASVLGDDLSIFKAKWALAQVTQAEGQVEDSARQRESVEKSAGPAVPSEFRIQILKEAQQAWIQTGQKDQSDRIGKRIAQLQRNSSP